MSRRVRSAVAMCGMVPILAGCDRGREASAEVEAGGAVEAAPLDTGVARVLPAGATPEMAEEGRELFAVCAVCHGFDAAGTQLGPSLRDAEWARGTGELEEIASVIRSGVAEPEGYPVPMPELGGGAFTPSQVKALAAYVYALSRAPR